MTHSIHRMTAEYVCVDCGRAEGELYAAGCAISGYDPLYPPHTPAHEALVYRNVSSPAGLASYAHRIGE